jgi:hypothetical protein
MHGDKPVPSLSCSTYLDATKRSLMLPAKGLACTSQVLEDVTEFETGADGVTETQMEQILLNGNNIAVLRPGGKPE